MQEASHFIAETYLPRGSAAPPWSWRDGGVRSLCIFFVPEDELCLYVFEAPSGDAVAAAGRLAGVPFDRVSAARLVHGNPIGTDGERDDQAVTTATEASLKRKGASDENS
jgi:hypothetical protein